MKPHLISSDQVEAMEEIAGEAFGKARNLAEEGAAAARGAGIKNRWLALDRLLVSLGSEISSLLIIFLALALLCAPVGLGLAAIYFLAAWAVRETGHHAAGWTVAMALFAFLCRYVWGAKLQRACRAAALALIAGKS